MSLWNFIDWGYLTICPLFIFKKINEKKADDIQSWDDNLAVISCIAIILLYVKLFQYLRIFKRFTTFIRMVQDMIADVKIFSVMLLIILMALANMVMILNHNRDEETQIFDSYTEN
jgi:hypothetical protein